jgi:hypothetical protein
MCGECGEWDCEDESSEFTELASIWPDLRGADFDSEEMLEGGTNGS